MAKSASKRTKRRRTQKKPVDNFSESEMDVAQQLIQLSGDSGADDDTINISVEQRKDGDHAADVSSTNNTTGEFFEEEEEEEILSTRKRRFRSVDHLYRSTKPLAVDKAKKIIRK
ncbi:hypothetical protein I3843_05G039300 [Carya illinoinensis]|uniref:Uncharacterized protein n=1 Tax=Carya illinoinensis TaxID=32201 RepID=A0A922EVT6_CARIL|nr:hypothetical protein I3842_05G042200 [Carya illinoinensis]KAG7977595.1 hypothetical protein I3843_05G039300 [Carya illinoinensis]